MKYLKYVMIFVLGAGAGSLVTWKFVSKKANEKANLRADEEISGMRQYWEMELDKEVLKKMNEELGYSEGEEEKEESEEPEEDDSSEEDIYGLMKREKEKIAERFNYSNISKSASSEKKNNPVSNLEKELDEEEVVEPAEGEEEIDILEEEEVNEVSKKKEKVLRDPYVVSPIEYDYQFIDDSKETLYYYAKSDVLVNEEGEQFDIEEIIGNDALRRVGEFTDNVVYVRNPLLESKFEVVYMNSEFEE